MNISTIIRLQNGATVLNTSPGHSLKCSDGTLLPPCSEEVASLIEVKREFKSLSPIKGMGVSTSSQYLTGESVGALRELSAQADIVLVSFMVIAALREMGIRDEFPGVLAYNATEETRRSAPKDKVVDIDNWAY